VEAEVSLEPPPLSRERATDPRKLFPTYRGGEHSPGEGRGTGRVRSPCEQPNANVGCPGAIRPGVRSAREKAGIPRGYPETKQALRKETSGEAAAAKDLEPDMFELLDS
jgi:hypothetical protein